MLARNLIRRSGLPTRRGWNTTEQLKNGTFFDAAGAEIEGSHSE
jgi:hypothetical protein